MDYMQLIALGGWLFACFSCWLWGYERGRVVELKETEALLDRLEMFFERVDNAD